MTADLDRIIAKQPPAMAKLTRDVLAKIRQRFPGAVELVYRWRRRCAVPILPSTGKPGGVL